MRILVVGAGASGVLFAIARKRSHPKDEIIILEHLDEPLPMLAHLKIFIMLILRQI